jgi:hypothetical protein
MKSTPVRQSALSRLFAWLRIRRVWAYSTEITVPGPRAEELGFVLITETRTHRITGLKQVRSCHVQSGEIPVFYQPWKTVQAATPETSEDAPINTEQLRTAS